MENFERVIRFIIASGLLSACIMLAGLEGAGAF